jgi:ubiquinone/menaquinone biosynthesis C-methylase UbiE
MPQFHFVEDYERLVAHLIEKYPIDEAMSLAVGGRYHEVGAIESEIMRYAGLQDGMSLVDRGCGSGRLASVLSRSLNVQFTGIDIVQSLLDYAKTKAPTHYRFLLHRELSIPSEENQTDFVSAFSVFTHLLQARNLYISRRHQARAEKGGQAGFLIFGIFLCCALGYF